MAFTSFTNEFLNSPIQPTYQSTLLLDFSTVPSTVTLEWPFINPSTDYPFSQCVFASNTQDDSVIVFPDATLASMGQTIIVSNQGEEEQDLTILYADGTTLLQTIAESVSWIFILTDNSTANGTWEPIQLGATASEATAADLVDTSLDSNDHVNSGGLAAFPTNFLKQNILVNTFTPEDGSLYTQASGDRGTLLVWTAGTGTYQCRAANVFGQGYFFTIRNASDSALITVEPDPTTGQTINGSTVAFIMNPGDTCSFVSNGVDTIYSFASSAFQSNSIDLIAIDLGSAVGGQITLTSDQADYSIQKFQGGTEDVTVIYPSGEYAEWIAYNASSFNIYVELNGGTTTSLIPPGNRLFLFSDSIDLLNVPNFLGDTTIYLQDGSETNPSLTFIDSQTTGFYLPADDVLGVTSNATEVFSFSNTGNTSLYPITVPLGTSTIPAISFQANPTKGLFYDGITPVMAGGSNTANGSLKDQDISIYSLMRAYG